MDPSVLETAGLTKNEAAVYLALLELGSSPASKIIEKTGLHHAAVYAILNRLGEKGLIGFQTGKRKLFEASNPQRLLEILEEKKDQLKTILPELKSLSNSKSSLEVKVYKGKEGIKTALEQILENNPLEIMDIGPGKEVSDLIPSINRQFNKRRVELQIKIKILFVDDPQTHKIGVAERRFPLCEVRYFPLKIHPPVTVVNHELIVLVSVTEENIPFAIVVKSKKLAGIFKQYFDWVWELSRKEEKV